MNNGIQWSDLIFNLSISFFGGLIKSITTKVKQKTWTYFFASAVVGGFAGLLTYMLCNSFNLSWQMTSFATGVAGYMGDSILKVFSEILPNFLTGKFNIQISSAEDKNKDKEKDNKEIKDDKEKKK